MKRSALKGRKLTWINPTPIVPQNEFRVCLAVLETHLESLFCDDGFPAWRCTKNRFPGRLADRKSTVAALPAEAVMAFGFYDSGRTGFETLDQFGEGDLSGESAKNVDMIFHSANLKRVALQPPQGSGQIGLYLRSEFGRLQKWHSIFG